MRSISQTRDRSRLVLTFVAVLYVVRVIASGWRSGFPLFFPDSSSYVSVSRLGPIDPQFWFADRPVGVPLVLWLSGGNHRLFFLVQTVLFAVSLAFLCSVILRVITSRFLAWLTCAAVTSISVHPRFGVWHLEILSESLSFSLSLLLIAAWTLFAREPTKRHLITSIGVTVAWMSVRDVHIVVGLVIAMVLFIAGTAGRRWSLRRTALIGSTVLVAFSSYVLVAQSSSNRNLYPLINNIGERVLTDPEVSRTFANRSMPVDDALLERTGDDTWSDDQAFLRSANLTDFRVWARADGQRALLTSFVVDPTYWIGTTRSALDASLPLDFTEYDRHSTSERLPTRLFWFQGPRTSLHFALWAGASILALVVLVASRRSRRVATIGAVALSACAADLFVSACGDSVEVQRHILGSILRLTLLFVIVCAFGAQRVIDLIKRRSDSDTEIPRPSERRSVSISGSIAVSLGAVALLGTWVALEHRSQDFDPQYVRTIIERAARFGGSYYENGIHNKGPLETAIYDSVRLFTSDDTYWFGISTYIVLASILLGATAATIARSLGASRRLAITASVLVTAHFAISDSDYSGVLYSRNITTAILALAVVVTLWNAPWRTPARATTTYMGLFVLLGFAVQTLLTTIFAAIVVGAFVHIRRSSTTSLRQPAITASISAAVSIATAPVWYALRGSFTEFWANWWTYAGFMSSSTGRSLLNQFGLGMEKLFGYYQDRPYVVLLVAAHVFLIQRAWTTMTTRSRTIHIMLLTWLIAGWIELVLSQRYSSHYFSVIAVPTALIAVATAVLLIEAVASRSASGNSSREMSWWVTLGCVITLLSSQGTQLTWIAIEAAGRFRGTNQYVEARDESRSGTQTTHQAVMDLVSSPGDSLLAWTMYPWTYLDNRRVPATRFSWKSFLIGEIYLGRTSSEYVLDRTWDWFDDDLNESQPKVFARPQVTALEPATHLSQLVEDDFITVFSDDDLEIGWRKELWRTATAATPNPLSPNDPPAGWMTDENNGVITARESAAPWVLPLTACQRLSTEIERTSSADPAGLLFRFESIDPDVDTVTLGIDFDRSWSARITANSTAEPIELDATVLPASNRKIMDVVLLVTPDAAALVVGDRIVSAVPIDGRSAVSMTALGSEVMIINPTTGNLKDFARCR